MFRVDVSSGRLFFLLESLHGVDVEPLFLEAASSEPLFKGLAFSLGAFQDVTFITKLGHFSIFLHNDEKCDFRVHSLLSQLHPQASLALHIVYFEPEGDHVPALWALDAVLTMASHHERKIKG